MFAGLFFCKDGSSQRPGGDKCFFHSLVLMDLQHSEAAANTSPASQESRPQQSSAGSALPAPASPACLRPCSAPPVAPPQLQALGWESGCWAVAGDHVAAPVPPSAMLGPPRCWNPRHPVQLDTRPRGWGGAVASPWGTRGGKLARWHTAETHPVPGSAWHPQQYPGCADTCPTQTHHAAPTWRDTVQGSCPQAPHRLFPHAGGVSPYTSSTPLQMSPPGTPPSSPTLPVSLFLAPALTFTMQHISRAVPRAPSHSGTPLSPLSSSPQHTGLQSIGLLQSCAPHTHLSHLSPTHSGDRTPGAGLCPSLDVAARGLASQTQPGKAGTTRTAPGAKQWRGRRQLPLKEKYLAVVTAGRKKPENRYFCLKKPGRVQEPHAGMDGSRRVQLRAPGRAKPTETP